jgi:hypothetical protein
MGPEIDTIRIWVGQIRQIADEHEVKLLLHILRPENIG